MIAGIGIGMVIAALLMLPFQYGRISAMEVEREAKKLGMVYPENARATNPQETTKGAIEE